MHYLQKVQKLTTTREKKKLSNPNYNEAPNEAERIIRNNRKFDTAKTNYMQADKRCISELENLNTSQDHLIQQIIVSLLHFYKNYYYGGSTSFSLCCNAVSNVPDTKPHKISPDNKDTDETEKTQENEKNKVKIDVKLNEINKHAIKQNVNHETIIPEEKKQDPKGDEPKQPEKKITNRKYTYHIGA